MSGQGAGGNAAKPCHTQGIVVVVVGSLLFTQVWLHIGAVSRTNAMPEVSR